MSATQPPPAPATEAQIAEVYARALADVMACVQREGQRTRDHVSEKVAALRERVDELEGRVDELEGMLVP